MKKILLIFFGVGLYIGLLAQEVDTIVWNGDSDKRINLVFLGDGYQEVELPNYLHNVKMQTQALFSTPPFDNYASHFNVLAISRASADSGASHPSDAEDEAFQDQPVAFLNTAYECTFDYFGVHRSLSHTSSQAFYDLLNYFPEYDQPIMLSNTPYYGGSGGYIPVGSLHDNSFEVVIHELAHSFAGLADEYWAGSLYIGEYPNMSSESDSTLVRWKDWVDFEGVGVYEHCCGGDGWYRPHEICKMRYLGAPFCAVCREAIVDEIMDLTTVIESFSPSISNMVVQDKKTFKLDLLKPEPNTLKVEWILNGEVIANNVDSVLLSANYLNKGLNVLVAEIIDTTKHMRLDSHVSEHLNVVSWLIDFQGSHVISAFLEGTYEGNNTMRNDLYHNQLLPLEQPYSLSPFYYTGTEKVDSYSDFSPNTVDWVLVELRVDEGCTVVAQKAGLLMKNGAITHTDGSSLTFDNLEASIDYYIAVRHRNHLGVMSKQPIELVGNKNRALDFTNMNTFTYGEEAQSLKGNVQAMWAGNTDDLDQVIFQGSNNDVNSIFFRVLTDADNLNSQINFVELGYYVEDVNLDGQTIYQGTNNDPNFIFFNVLVHPDNTNSGINFVIDEQLPCE